MQRFRLCGFFCVCSDIHGALLLVTDETESGLVPAEQYRDTAELGDITLENWPEKDPKPEKWNPDWFGPEPAWFKTGQRKVVTNADYTKSKFPDGASFARVKLVNAKFNVSDGSRNSIYPRVLRAADGLNNNALIR